ncbi:unnamed protein product [Rotaria sordida]|uniref:Uncharacterized protein n=1 Tax=Rotaria sordida TaxID=392033 RepID=A0A815HV46_9BILA|nr:unnamed protein product [Rotaria sordida]CAF1604782.1 unnamed protein product [Rotaria sordida]
MFCFFKTKLYRFCLAATVDCTFAVCTMDLKICPDGTPAPIPVDECCPSLKACAINGDARSNPLGSLGSILSGSNLLQSLTTATHGTNLGTAISILNLLNNVQQLSNDIHQIPLLINQTLVSILNGTGQAGQIIVDQLIGAVNSVNHQTATSRNLLDTLGYNGNLLSSITHINDIHQIPTLLNQTLTSIVGGAGQASQIVIQQVLGLLGQQTATSRNLLDVLGQNGNLLSSISHLLPQGTSISTVLSILKLLNNVHQLSTSRNLLNTLGANTNLISTISHLLPQGTSISTIVSLLNLLNNVNAINNDLHQIPTVLQETLQHLLTGIQNLVPSVVQLVQGSS